MRAEALVVKAEKYMPRLHQGSKQVAEHAGRKTIKKEDVDLGLKALSSTLF